MTKNQNETVELGDRVKDKATGMKGIAVARTRWIHGCLRWAVQPSVGKDNKKLEAEWVDDPNCEILEKAVIKDTIPTDTPPRHGPRDDPMQQTGAKY